MKRNISFAAAAASAAAALAAALLLAMPASAAAPSDPAVSGTEHFQIVNTVASADSATVVATGVFIAGGFDTFGGTQDRLSFPAGSFKVTHFALTKASLNPTTCLLTDTGSGSYTISSGFGSYTGISGSGTYKLSILAVYSKSGGTCDTNAAPQAWQEIIKASGPVTL